MIAVIFLESDVNINELFDAHELIEGESLFDDLSLIILVDASCVNFLISHGKRHEACWFDLLHLELWHDERVLSEFGLSFLFDRHSHSLKNSWLM